jgi:hypothetical protein
VIIDLTEVRDGNGALHVDSSAPKGPLVLARPKHRRLFIAAQVRTRVIAPTLGASAIGRSGIDLHPTGTQSRFGSTLVPIE